MQPRSPRDSWGGSQPRSANLATRTSPKRRSTWSGHQGGSVGHFVSRSARSKAVPAGESARVRSNYHRNMSRLPGSLGHFDSKRVTVIRHERSDCEVRFEVDAHVQPKKGFFPVETPIYEGDVVEIPDPRGGVDRRIAKVVEVFDHGPKSMQHTEVTWGKAGPVRSAGVRRLGLENLHPEVADAASNLFVDGHYSQAVFESLKALEQRVREQSGLDVSGRDLMTKAFSGNPPPIDLSIEAGQSGRDEQEGLRFVFMGAIQGIRNPKGHALVKQDDPQRALEYLGMVSVLFRRLDDARQLRR